MIEVEEQHNTAKIFTNNLEDSAEKVLIYSGIFDHGCLTKFGSYLFGLILTDGSISLYGRNQGRVSIELQASDLPLLEDIQRRVSNSSIHNRTRDTNYMQNYKSSCWTNHHKLFRELLFICGMPKRDKSILGDIPIVPYSESDFWRGVFDGDGSIGFTSNGEPFVSMVIVSESLKLRLCNMLRVKFAVYKNLSRNTRDNVYNVILKNEHAIEFANFIYHDADIYLPRKYGKFCQFSQWQRVATRHNKRSWSQEEIDFILNNTIADSSLHLKRSEQSIKTKLWRIKHQENNQTYL